MMGRNFSRKHASDVETAQETIIPLSSAAVMPKRTDRESQKLTVQANMQQDHFIDDLSDKRT